MEEAAQLYHRSSADVFFCRRPFEGSPRTVYTQRGAVSGLVFRDRAIWIAGRWGLRFGSSRFHSALLFLVAEWIHSTLFGIILPTIKLKVYTVGGLMNSATKVFLLFWERGLKGDYRVNSSIFQRFLFVYRCFGWSGALYRDWGGCLKGLS